MGQVEFAMNTTLTKVGIMLLNSTQINILMLIVRNMFLTLTSIYFNNTKSLSRFKQKLSQCREKHEIFHRISSTEYSKVIKVAHKLLNFRKP